MNLLIVESPAKAKTIEKYLGKDFTVRSCYGHIRDLGKDKNAVDVENDFHPTYIVPKEKMKVVNELKSWVKKSDEVWLATDEDREVAMDWSQAGGPDDFLIADLQRAVENGERPAFQIRIPGNEHNLDKANG